MRAKRDRVREPSYRQYCIDLAKRRGLPERAIYDDLGNGLISE